MTRDQYIDYWTTWLRRKDPAVKLDVNYDQGSVTMTRQGVKYEGYAIECACGEEQCLGWTMATVKERLV
jgi:hypothetical protein